MDDIGAVVITGAAGTIGQATARLLAAEKRPLFLLDKDEAKVQALAKTVGAVAIVADVTDAKQVADAFAQAAMKGLAAVVLAAGTEGPIGPLEECDDDGFDAVMQLNVKSVWLGLKQSLRLMKPQGHGSIVALSSISGVIGAPRLAPYAASKHAVMGLVRTAAREAASFNVRVNGVCPAPVASDMMRRIDQGLGRSDASKMVPMQRYATADEIARSIAFLCSDASSYCTGSAFMVDGGITCR